MFFAMFVAGVLLQAWIGHDSFRGYPLRRCHAAATVCVIALDAEDAGMRGWGVAHPLTGNHGCARGGAATTATTSPFLSVRLA